MDRAGESTSALTGSLRPGSVHTVKVEPGVSQGRRLNEGVIFRMMTGSIILTCALTSVFIFLKKGKDREFIQQILLCAFIGACAALAESFLLRYIYSALYNAARVLYEGQAMMITPMIINSVAKNAVIFIILLVVIARKKEGINNYDGIAFSVFISLGYSVCKALFTGLQYGLPIDYPFLVYIVPITITSAVILGYFVIEARIKKEITIELYLIGFGGALCVDLVYKILHAFVSPGALLSLIYAGIAVVMSVLLTRSRIKEDTAQ